VVLSRRSFAAVAGAVCLALWFAAAGGDAPPGGHWIGTWATAPQPAAPRQIARYSNQTLRLIVHTSVAGARARIRLSNLFGDEPLRVGAAHVARRTKDASIDARSDRAVTFDGREAVTVAPGSALISDAVDFDVPALSDIAISVFVIDAMASTVHLLAQQTSYVSRGNATSTPEFPTERRIKSWPFLIGVDVFAPSRASAIVAFGDSIVDGDGATADANARWPDELAARLQRAHADVGVLNEGIIGNRLLRNSPLGPHSPLGAAFGPSGLSRFERDALDQPGVETIIVRIGVNDVGFPGTVEPETERPSAEQLIGGYRQLIARAHEKGLRIVGTTMTPFEGATVVPGYYSPEKELIRERLNAWTRSSHEFDAIVDFDAVVRDPGHPRRLLPEYDSGDHLHLNDAGYGALGRAVPLEEVARNAR
jgi:lysophospholipase L1-like esterase